MHFAQIIYRPHRKLLSTYPCFTRIIKLNLSEKQKARWYNKCLCLVEFENVGEITLLNIRGIWMTGFSFSSSSFLRIVNDIIFIVKSLFTHFCKASHVFIGIQFPQNKNCLADFLYICIFEHIQFFIHFSID